RGRSPTRAAPNRCAPSGRRCRWSARRELAPEPVRAPGCDFMPQPDGPAAFVAELRAPRPQAARGEVQRVLVGEADRAVRLVGDAGADAGCLPGPDLRHRHLEGRVPAVSGTERVVGRDAGGGDVTGQDREVVLDRLECGEGPAELFPL